MGEVFKEKLTLLTWLNHLQTAMDVGICDMEKNKKSGAPLAGAGAKHCSHKEGGLPFWEFSVAIIWRRNVPTGLWV